MGIDETILAANAADIESWSNFFDISIIVTIELGRTKMKMENILDLKIGSIIQLSRSTGEGMDVIANDRIVARGDILTVEDHISIRVNEIRKPVK